MYFFLNFQEVRWTSGQSNLAKAASNPWVKSGPQSYVPWVSKSLHHKQDLDPFEAMFAQRSKQADKRTRYRNSIAIV